MNVHQLSIGDIIQTASIVTVILIFVITNIIGRRRDRQLARREIYQRLELSSIELFRFEADHIDCVRTVSEKDASIPSDGTAEAIVVTNYVCQVLNLFEMAVQFRKDNIMPPEVFGSWVKWFYTFLSRPHFAVYWPKVRMDYTFSLRKIIDYGLKLRSEEYNEQNRQIKFFEFVGKDLDCKVVRKWIKDEIKLAERKADVKGYEEKTVNIQWCTNPKHVDQLINFFIDNVDKTYISHGEIQDGRADDTQHWSPFLKDVLQEEFLASLSTEVLQNKGIAVAYVKEKLAALLVVERFEERHKQYAVLHDLVVAHEYRALGIGTKVIQWLEQVLKQHNIEEIYLESGKHNHKAHHFFERQGFEQCSIVMRKSLN